jgi:hypothetical protein
MHNAPFGMPPLALDMYEHAYPPHRNSLNAGLRGPALPKSMAPTVSL